MQISNQGEQFDVDTLKKMLQGDSCMEIEKTKNQLKLEAMFVEINKMNYNCLSVHEAIKKSINYKNEE